jgi:hypothetical protein
MCRRRQDARLLRAFCAHPKAHHELPLVDGEFRILLLVLLDTPATAGQKHTVLSLVELPADVAGGALNSLVCHREAEGRSTDPLSHAPCRRPGVRCTCGSGMAITWSATRSTSCSYSSFGWPMVSLACVPVERSMRPISARCASCTDPIGWRTSGRVLRTAGADRFSFVAKVLSNHLPALSGHIRSKSRMVEQLLFIQTMDSPRIQHTDIP